MYLDKRIMVRILHVLGREGGIRMDISRARLGEVEYWREGVLEGWRVTEGQDFIGEYRALVTSFSGINDKRV